MKKIKVLFLLILFSLLIFPFLSFQDNFEEKILFFSSAISIAEDGSITVHETIVVDCQNIEINHGIYRDLPLYDNTNKFLLKPLGLEIIEGKLDGNLAIAKIEKKEGNQRIYLGDPNNIIEKEFIHLK